MTTTLVELMLFQTMGVERTFFGDVNADQDADSDGDYRDSKLGWAENTKKGTEIAIRVNVFPVYME